jgi:uncharacterized protein YjcR
MNDDLLADLKEWAESYEAVESGADGVLYAAINRIEQLNKRVEQLKNLLEERDAFIVKNNLWQAFVAALEERKDG